MVVMIFVNGLQFEFGMTKTQILSGSEIPHLEEAFSRVLRTENTQSNSFLSQSNNVLIGRNNDHEVTKGTCTNSQKIGYDSRQQDS